MGGAWGAGPRWWAGLPCERGLAAALSRGPITAPGASCRGRRQVCGHVVLVTLALPDRPGGSGPSALRGAGPPETARHRVWRRRTGGPRRGTALSGLQGWCGGAFAAAGPRALVQGGKRTSCEAGAPSQVPCPRGRRPGARATLPEPPQSG